MPEGLYLVFSQKPERISAQDYDRWYADHLRENLAAPGFRAGRRFEIESTGVGGGQESGPHHLGVYECDAELAELRAGLERRIETGAVVLPEWFGEIRFSSWYGRPLEERVEEPHA